MCDPKPTTFWRISFWKPFNTATEITITASPSAMPAIATLMIGREKDAPLFVLMRLLIKYSKFNLPAFLAKLINTTRFVIA